jgi:hypothetical protein
MNISAILGECKSHGVTVFLANGKVSAKGNREALDKFRPVLKQHKVEVQRFLSEQSESVVSTHANSRSIAESLAQFRFDLVQADIDAGYPVAELHRVNNMAWEFMQVDGMAFKDAITLAAEIVVSGQVAACEAAYCDVMALFQKVTNAKD